jgi:serine/threonine-protein kinase RIO1
VARYEYSEAARAKREEMCHGVRGESGVRTVGREEFTRMRGSNGWDERLAERRKGEERGMGNLLRSSGTLGGVDGASYGETECCAGDDAEEADYDEYEEGIRMNPQSGRGSVSSNGGWKRLDKDTFVGANNEIRTKHDPELGKTANAMKLKDAYSIGSTSVSDSAYNSFVRAEARQSGTKKGVAKQGHGRAENMNAAKTRGGAMDAAVRLQIAAAINNGLIDKCNGVVKEGKEALVYHAEAGWRAGSLVGESTDPDDVGSDGYDVAVKVFKRISEFKGRGAYVDGDPRFHRQKFKSNDQREQVVLWAEKEYRNLIRASRGGVPVPFPLRQKENVLFMRFLGDNGWPSPQLKEVEMKKGSDRWTVLYLQTIAAIRR